MKNSFTKLRSLPSRFACNCSKSAKSLGFPGFLLTFYGECYGLTLATLDNIEVNGVEETVCVSNMANGTLINCNRKIHKICTGLAWAGAVYKLKNDSMERTSTNKSEKFGSFVTLCMLYGILY